VFSAAAAVDSDITVYAQWIPAYYVVFRLNDGTERIHAERTVMTPATTLTDFPADPARDGYIFTGWNIAADGPGAAFTPETTLSGHITVYARWIPGSPGSYYVAFRLNDGTEAIHAEKTVTAPATTIGAADFPADPVRSGYTFTGWNIAADGSGTPFTPATTVSGHITVYARWTAGPPDSHTVTFRLNDGTETIHAEKTVTAPATTIGAADFPANPTRTGYNFEGWNTVAHGLEIPFTPETTVSGPITVYARWTANTYTVTFRLNDETGMIHAEQMVTAPATTLTDFPADPARYDYAFTGWNTAADGSETAFTAETTVSGDISVYAQWTANTYTVTFRLNDGTTGNHAVKPVTVPATTLADFPADPVRSGYTFTGWRTDADGWGATFTAETTVNGDITVYARWTANTYNVTFRRNDGTETIYIVKSVTVPATTIDNMPDPPARTEYNFVGWYTSQGGGSEFTAATRVTGDITVYARWIHFYTVSFNSNGGTAANPDTKTVFEPATTIDSLPDPPSWTGYIFDGWYTEYNGNGSEFTAATTVSASITVYAKWTDYSYTVSFNSGENTDANADPATKTVASPVTTIDALPAPPVKIGYGFGGWYTAVNGGGSAFTAATTVSSNITVYAKWNSHSWTVSFDNNNGDTNPDPAAKIVASPAITIDALPVPPARTDYNFVGWNTAANGSGTAFTPTTTVSGNIRVYAQWSHEQFDITLNLDAGEGTFSQGTFALSKGGTPKTQTINITGTGYTNPRWFVDGALRGTDTGIVIDAADYHAGGHTLTLFISKSGVSWSKEIKFTVAN
jgi:uncharacterized repeat protein (TIGR02543 family)